MTAPASPPRRTRPEIENAALVAACKRAIAEAELGYRPPAAITEGLLRDLARAAPHPRPASLQAHECVARVFGAMQARFERSAPALEIATGLSALDDALGGLHRGELVLISGAPESGRSALAHYLAHAVASAKAPTVLRSFGEAMPTFMLRMLLGVTGVESTSSFTGEEWDRLVHEAGELSRAPLWVMDDGPSTVSSLGVLCDSLDARLRPEFALGLALVVVDDVDAARGGVHLALRSLRRLARRRGVAVVATAPRGVELRKLAEEAPDVVLRVRRPRRDLLSVRGGRLDGCRELRAELVIRGGARWIDPACSNELAPTRAAKPDEP